MPQTSRSTPPAMPMLPTQEPAALAVVTGAVPLVGASTLITEPIRMELVRMPAGEFMMGSDSAKVPSADSDEQPQHPVTLAEFYIGKHGVTNAQFATFVAATGRSVPSCWENGRVPAGKQDHPVVYMSWDDAAAFTQWLGEETGA